jgi:hypothetical protein
MKKYLLAILIAIPCISLAQTESHLKVSENYLEVSGIKVGFNNIVDDVIKSQSGQMPKEYQEKFKEVMKSFMDKYYTYDILKPKLAKIYADEFTELELKDLIVFYSSPTGKKFADKIPSLTKKGMEIGANTVKDHQEELQEMMKKAFSNK